jgi:hypothetical protein
LPVTLEYTICRVGISMAVFFRASLNLAMAGFNKDVSGISYVV